MNASIAVAAPSITTRSPMRTFSRRPEPGNRRPFRTKPRIATSWSSASGKISRNDSPINLESCNTVASETYPAKSCSSFRTSRLKRSAGRRRQPKSATNTTPTIATTPPTAAKSNIRNGSPSASLRKVATTILGGVPIRVTIPPRIVAKDKGIKVSAGLRSACFAASPSTGIKSANAATLFINADKAAPTPDISPICIVTVREPFTT